MLLEFLSLEEAHDSIVDRFLVLRSQLLKREETGVDFLVEGPDSQRVAMPGLSGQSRTEQVSNRLCHRVSAALHGMGGLHHKKVTIGWIGKRRIIGLAREKPWPEYQTEPKYGSAARLVRRLTGNVL